LKTTHAIEIPASAMDALRDYAACRTQQAAKLNDIDELCRSTGPLTGADRKNWRTHSPGGTSSTRQQYGG
jgi:hypothetical protein